MVLANHNHRAAAIKTPLDTVSFFFLLPEMSTHQCKESVGRFKNVENTVSFLGRAEFLSLGSRLLKNL